MMDRTRLSGDKYFRLVFCLIETCSSAARRLLNFHIEKSRPVDFKGSKWTIDDFLYSIQKTRPLTNFTPEQLDILFPERKSNTDIDRWDISLLFKVLELFDLDPVLKKDIFFIRQMRNRIFHAGSVSIEDSKYEVYKKKIVVYVQNLCKFLGDQTLPTEIDIFGEETKLNKEAQSRVMSDFEKWFKSDPLFNCTDTIPSDIGSIMDVLFERIVDLLRSYRFQIPDAYLNLQINRCNPGISEVVSDQLFRHLCQRTSPEERESKLGKAISDAKTKLIDKQRKLIDIRKGCLILRIQSKDLDGVWCLISDCISGKLTSSWRDVQNIVREEHGAPYLTIDVGVTASEIISCVEELVQNIAEGINNKIQMSSSTKHTIPEEETTKEQTYEEGNLEARLSRLCGARTEHDEFTRGYGRALEGVYLSLQVRGCNQNTGISEDVVHTIYRHAQCEHTLPHGLSRSGRAIVFTIEEHAAPYLTIEVMDLVRNISEGIGNQRQRSYVNVESGLGRSNGAMVQYDDDYNRWFFRRDAVQEISTNTGKGKRKTYGRIRVWDEIDGFLPMDVMSDRNIEIDGRKVLIYDILPPVSDNEGWSSEGNARKDHRVPTLFLSAGHRWVDFT